MKFSPQAALGASPSAGQSVDINGISYTVEKVLPYKRLDGEQSHIITWTFRCKTCGGAKRVDTGIRSAVLHPQCKECWSRDQGEPDPGQRKAMRNQAFGERMKAGREAKRRYEAGLDPLICRSVFDVRMAVGVDELRGFASFNDGVKRPIAWSPVTGGRVVAARNADANDALAAMHDRLIELYRLNGGTSPIFA